MPNVFRETAVGIKELALTDVHFNERKIFLTNEIRSETCVELIQQLMYLNGESNAPITLYINSHGGSVTDGLALYDAIRMSKSPVTTVCMGHASSMAAIIFLAGERRIVFPKSEIMIHDPSYAGGQYTGQKPREIQKHLNSLCEMRDVLCTIIAERTGMSLKAVRNKTAYDCYLNAEEAIKLKIATEIADTI